MENTKSTAYAFMIMLAGLAVIGYLGRASAEVAPPNAYAAATPGAAPGGYAPQYGLIQTGVMGVAQLDGLGGFGRPSAMPVFQIVQLQPAGTMSQASYEGGSRNAEAAQAQQPAMASAEAMAPQGTTVTQPQMAGALCDIKGIRVLTQSPESCAMAGGQAVHP